MRRLPGQANTTALLISGFWTAIMLFVIIIGHLVWVFIAFGVVTKTDALKDLETFLPLISQTNMYILAGLAIAADVWIIISSKKEHKSKLNRQR